MNITHKIKHKLLCIYIDNIVHIQVDRTKVFGYDTWFWPGIWSIKITSINGAIIVTEYTKEESWKQIINLLENHLMPLD